ncbi:hypothetical protein Plec18167_002001 [Paecilomyces lecythidis]|uniref:Intradiol ring-cleavage dioxygenases domain-containing protein n=1 Tax=Paecilomyces lecythidis TaxID=3004212 RepID=A0ABR3Y9E6_9EURO
MVQLTRAIVTGIIGFLAGSAIAHPGHDVKAEAAERAAFLKKAPLKTRSLGQCSEVLRTRGHEAKNIDRRHETVQRLRQKRGLERRTPHIDTRDLDTALNTSHHSTLPVSPSTDPEILFRSNSSCILGPDVTQGPYYVTGELVRSNIVEDQQGVPLYLDIQLIDTNTCNPVPQVYIDIWHCNSTGVYSGVVASGNGNSNDSSNIDSTFLRGIQKTDPSGVVEFETLFPGHYTGRATHIHVLSHAANGTVQFPNGTISGLYNTSSSHVGQLFFDQDLISQVEAVEPYSANTQELTTNADDDILAEEADTIDPFVQYVLLGEDITDGIFAWISFGIDATEDTTITPAAYYTESGGVSNPDSGAGMGGSPPNGTASSGPSSSSVA